jgi:hypothetical protein
LHASLFTLESDLNRARRKGVGVEGRNPVPHPIVITKPLYMHMYIIYHSTFLLYTYIISYPIDINDYIDIYIIDILVMYITYPLVIMDFQPRLSLHTISCYTNLIVLFSSKHS